jgi:N-acyl-D-aspartate/D-glutamate deacylase
MNAVCLLSLVLSADPVQADYVLKGGTIYDGSGTPGFVGDLALRGDRIVAVGKVEVKGDPKIIDCTGLFVTPGYIDLHTHSDSAMTEFSTKANRNYVRQGVTTIITGNCGSGPVNADRYFSAMEKGGIGSNVLHQAPHNSIRAEAMGNVNRPPTAAELDKMRKLVDDAMSAGCWSLSTGLIYNPGTYSSTEEIIELAKIVAKHGGFYASHIRGEGTNVLTSIEEAMRIGKEAGIPVHISHIKASGRKAHGMSGDIIAIIERARKSGQVVTADQYPYDRSSTSLRATVIPTKYREGSEADFVKRLGDPEVGAKIRQAILEDLKDMQNGATLRIARYSPKPQWQGLDIAAIATKEGKEPLDIVLEIERNGGAQIVHHSMNEEDVRLLMKQQWVATASDGSSMIPGKTVPHPRSYGCFARKIGRFAIQEKWLPVELAIRSASGLPADILGLPERGYLKPGHFADVVVFDSAAYRDTATFDKPHQYATGAKWVFINGKTAIADGKDTDALAGKVLRHERSERK